MNKGKEVSLQRRRQCHKSAIADKNEKIVEKQAVKAISDDEKK